MRRRRLTGTREKLHNEKKRVSIMSIIVRACVHQVNNTEQNKERKRRYDK